MECRISHFISSIWEEWDSPSDSTKSDNVNVSSDDESDGS